MARNDTRRFRSQSASPAQPRAEAESWRALASTTVASTLVVALVVSVLTLLESAFSTSAVKLARHVPHPSGAASSLARAATHEPFLPTPVQARPVLLVTD
jgi:hypothetical protein